MYESALWLTSHDEVPCRGRLIAPKRSVDGRAANGLGGANGGAVRTARTTSADNKGENRKMLKFKG
jgi:hypothetical protein